MMPRRLLTLLGLFVLAPSLVLAADWPYWRGPNMDGISPETNLPDSWDPEAEDEAGNILWKVPANCRSTPVLLNNRLYYTARDKEENPKEEGEKVVCLDAKTGKVLWETRFNVYLSDVPVERVGWSSVVGDRETGDVFALGVCGLFQCLDGRTGAVKWSHSMHEEYGLLSTYGGRTNFPIVHEDRVIISAVFVNYLEYAQPTHRFMAFDKRNGLPVWFSGTRVRPEDTTYSSPVLTTVNGELQMVFGSGDGAFWAFQPRTGKPLWNAYTSIHGLNHTPLVHGGKIYAGVGEELLDNNSITGALYCLDPSKAKAGDLDLKKAGGIVWTQNEWTVSRSSPVMIGNRLYVATDNGKLYVVNPENGELIAQQALGRMMRSSLLYADGKIWANELNGNCYVLKPTDAGVEVIHKLRLPRGEECHGSPIAANGRVYIPTTAAIYCVGKKEHDAYVETPLPLLEETPREEDNTPAQLQIVPVEALLRPGSKQAFHFRLYNAKGQYLRNAEPSEVVLSHTGPGKLNEDGSYEISKEVTKPGEAGQPEVKSPFAEHAPVAITAKLGELTSKARLRVVPDLKWSFNFDNGKVPPTWVGAAYRHIIIDWDLLTQLREKDPQAALLYIFLHSAISNAPPAPKDAPPGPTAVTFDDSTPQQRWTELLRFIRLANSELKPKTKEEAEAKLGPSLKLLLDEKVLGSAEWTTWDRATGEGDAKVAEPRLKVTKGDRPPTGNGVMCKITTIPKGQRSQAWFGHPDLTNYTVQADVQAFEKDGKLPDIGLTNQRYTLVIMGASQQIQLRTWSSQLDRFSVNVPFALEPYQWYTVKFQASVVDGKAVLKGKIWKKGTDEPADWTVTGEDGAAVSNTTGSPGLFADAKNAEVFYDNLTVYPNEAAPAAPVSESK